MAKYLLFGVILFAFISCADDKPKATIKQNLLTELSKLESDVQQFRHQADSQAGKAQLLENFKVCRLQYKKTEWAVEYFLPETARGINGPALDEIEIEENKFFPPNGFQVIEELLTSEESDKKQMLQEIDVLLSNIRQSISHFTAITLSDDYVMDALRMEVYRVITLGITGFDSPILNYSIVEARRSLIGIPGLIVLLENAQIDQSLLKILTDSVQKASDYCVANDDFNSFNRAVFIKSYLNPISSTLAEIQEKSSIPNPKRTRPVSAAVQTLFETGAFDPNAFVLSEEYQLTPEKIALGQQLFSDRNLSKNNDRSCVSCHIPEKAFTDGLKSNKSLRGHSLPRNTPTLTYASLQNAQFWDMRQSDLERQSNDVIINKDEMHGSMDAILTSVKSNADYSSRFKKAFPKTASIESWQIQNAIASYVRSLNAFNSRFDDYMRNENSLLSNEEIRGMNLFMGKAKCATCHFAPLFNGTVPPHYAKTEHEVVGTPADANGKKLSSDLGRYAFNKMPQLLGAFKTPTLRNAALTAPYMHNGVYTSLEEVIDFYNKGGGIGLGLSVERQTLPSDKLDLADSEKKALAAFIGTLTDKGYR